MVIHNFEQGTGEWFAIRKGKVTASHATAIGNCGKGLDTYILELMSEYFSSGDKEHFSNIHTDRGNELEPIARSIYELHSDNIVDQIGFAEYNEFVGCSPDGLVGEEGMIEIKCYDDKGFFNLLIEGEKEINSGYIWQIQMNMLILERKWCDFIAFNPNYSKSIFIHRIYPDAKKFDKLKEGFKLSEEKIKDLINKYKNLCSNK